MCTCVPLEIPVAPVGGPLHVNTRDGEPLPIARPVCVCVASFYLSVCSHFTPCARDSEPLPFACLLFPLPSRNRCLHLENSVWRRDDPSTPTFHLEIAVWRVVAPPPPPFISKSPSGGRGDPSSFTFHLENSIWRGDNPSSFPFHLERPHYTTSQPRILWGSPTLALRDSVLAISVRLPCFLGFAVPCGLAVQL